MATLTAAEINTRALNRAQVNVPTDAPVTTAEMLTFINDAYADVYEISGGRTLKVASATAWTSAQLATGVVAGILTDVAEIKTLWASTTSGSTGASSGDYPLRHVEFERIQALRGSSTGAYGTYSRPLEYAVLRQSTTTAADVNKLELHYWPPVTGFYLPMLYLVQFVPLTALDTTVPNVNDLESQAIALRVAARIAQLTDRHDLVPGIMEEAALKLKLAPERKLPALMDARADA